MRAILIDTTRCTGCMTCVAACMKGTGSDPTELIPGDAGLSGTQHSTVIELRGGGHAKKSCMHCLEPSCVGACLVGALEKTPDGPVVYDSEMCIGCRYCMLACPFHIPRYEWQETSPLMQKCDMCVERLDQGELPLCVEACPHQALELGERDELLEKARARIAAQPQKYRDHVWGETEWGGTSLLYLGLEDLEEIGWPPASTQMPISALTDPLIHATPFVGMGVLLGTLGLGAIIRRRNEVMSKEGRRSPEAADSAKEESDAE